MIRRCRHSSTTSSAGGQAGHSQSHVVTTSRSTQWPAVCRRDEAGAATLHRRGPDGADGFAVDASSMAAAANKQRSAPKIKETATRATKEYLAILDNAAFGAASPITPTLPRAVVAS